MRNRFDSASRLTEPANLPATPPQATTPPVDHTSPPPSPTMRSMPEESDGMHIDSGDEQAPASSRGIKRAWQQTVDATQNHARDDAPLPSAPPELKRQRTEAPPPPRVIETFSQQQHGDLIALIRRHGGDVVASDGDTVQLALPPDTQLDFQVHYFCQKLARLRSSLPFPGAETFGQTICETGAHLLSVAALTNKAPLVRMLLATGLANQLGTLLRQLAQQAGAAGAMAAVDAITDTCAYWMQGLDPATLSSAKITLVRVGDINQAPPDWQARVQRDMTLQQMQSLQVALRAGDTSAVFDLLFISENPPASGEFVVRPIGQDPGPSFLECLRSFGAVTIGNCDSTQKMIVFTRDFNQTGLQDHLLLWQSEDADADDDDLDADEPRDRRFDSPLLLAAHWGDKALFDIIWTSATGTQRRRHTDEALRHAAIVGATDIVLQLVAYADNAALNVDRPLIIAAANGQIATCAALIDAGIDLTFRTLSLAHAALRGQTATCAFLISKGTPIDHPNISVNPLAAAAAAGNQKICQLLVTGGARLDLLAKGYLAVDQKEPPGTPEVHWTNASVLSLAAGSGNISLYQYLLDQGAGTLVPQHHAPPMVHAAAGNHVPMLDYLLKSGEDIERADGRRNTPLMVACLASRHEAAAFLLEQKSYLIPNVATHERNAITYAVNVNSLSILQLLVRVKVDPSYWLQALKLAVAQQKPEMVNAMLPLAPLNPLAIGQTSKNNLLLAIPYRSYLPDDNAPHHPILARLLSERRLPLHHVDAHGHDALMLAVAAEDAAAVEMLLGAGLRIGQQDSSGRHALHFALDNIKTFKKVASNEGSDEDSSTDDDLYIDESAILSSRILHTLSQSLLQQTNRFHLVRDVWFSQTDLIKRDLALFLIYANSESTVDLPAMMALDGDHIGHLCDALREFSINASMTELIQALMDMGVPSPLHYRLLPLLSALLPISTSLFREDNYPDRAFQAAIDGLYLSLEAEMATLGTATAAHYAPTLLDNDWKTTLTDMARLWLTGRIDLAAERQNTDIAPVFGDLFNRCAETMVNGNDYRSALMQQPGPGMVAARLHEAGVYASLANEIDAAWRQAWQQVSDSVTTTDPRSNDELGDALLAAFRGALKKGVGEPSSAGNVITRIDAPAGAAQVYTDLMFQQLHMLGQFIRPETT